MAMTQVQYALAKLAEECNEVAKECSKIMQFGFDSFDPADAKQVTNLERLINELHDLEGAKLFLREQSFGKFEFIDSTIKALNKMDKIRLHMELSIELGMVEPLDEEEEDE